MPGGNEYDQPKESLLILSYFLFLQLSVLDTCALIMKIICLEIYYVVKYVSFQSFLSNL